MQPLAQTLSAILFGAGHRAGRKPNLGIAQHGICYLMGFQSSAQDYIERRLTVNDLVVHNPSSTLIVERDNGLLIIDRIAHIAVGDKVVLLHEGETLIARMGDRCVITENGEHIIGDEFGDLRVLGKITYETFSV
ncbi:hypothetical protein [Pantoea septica]|uniref:hypothetical protein n=1 Tax=Pantoea septica TaxID=472695 RepID=UPI002897B159|nr:hypothetical protein [Pantoea septica]